MSDDPFDDGSDHGDDESDREESEGDEPHRDPFADFAEHGDREGDPFERLGDPASSDAEPADATGGTDSVGGADSTGGTDPESGTDGSDAGDEYTEPDPFEYIGDERRGQPAGADSGSGPGGPAAGGGGVDAETAGPAGGADPLSDVEVSDADPFEAPGGVFEQVDVGAVDPDEVWDRLTGEPESDTAPADGEDDVVEVSKHSFCEGCEHFSAPPDVHCTHEGTEILEFTDVETVRVANCPVVVERRELGGFEE